MKKILLILILLLTAEISAQSFTGYVLTESGMPLAGATVILIELKNGSFTDPSGYFIIKNVPDGEYTVSVSYVGYSKIEQRIIFSGERRQITFHLKEAPITTGQVIVTASKREEKISELPLTAVVINPLSIETRNRITLDEALRYVPGVTLSLDQISIRGSSGYSKGAGTRVLTAIDGVPFYTGDTGEIIWEMIPVSNIERVEIIKGPASSLYGSTAIGGVINVISREIVDRPVTQISSFAGFYDSPYHPEWKWSGNTRSFYGIGINHSNKIGNISYTASIKRIGNDGYRENDFSKRLIGYAKVNFLIDEANSLSFFGNFLNMKRGNFLYWKDGLNALVPKEEDNGKTVESDRWFGSMIYKHTFSPALSAEFKGSIYSTKFDGIGIEVTSSKSSLYRGELLTFINPGNNFSITAGTEFSYSTINSNIFKSSNFNTVSAYSQLEYRGIEKLIATLGVRWDNIKLDSIEAVNAVNPKFGLNYTVNENFILRGSAGTGFRAPTPAEVFTSTGVGGIPIKENPDLTYESSFSVDAGAMILLNPNHKIDISLFYNTYQNFIEPVLLNSGYIQFVNLPKARTAGFEAVIEGSVIPGLIKSSIGYTYLWSRDVEKNTPMKYRPANSITASLSVTPGAFEFGADFRYAQKAEKIDEELTKPPITLVPDGDLRVDVYIIDLTAGYNFSIGKMPVRIYLNCKNALNYNYTEFIGNIAPIRSFSLSLDLFF